MRYILIIVLMLVGFSEARSNYQKVETYYSLVNPKVDLKCYAPIPYLKGSTIITNANGTFTVVVAFICGREA